MGDEGDFWKAYKEIRREERIQLGIPCPRCTVNLPRAQPTILMPRQRCRVCRYRDPRERGRVAAMTRDEPRS